MSTDPINVIVPEANRRAYEQGHYAPAVEHEGFIFVSGCIGRADAIEDEFRDAWQQVGAILAEAGCGYDDILESTLYMVDLQKNTQIMRKVIDEFIHC